MRYVIKDQYLDQWVIAHEHLITYSDIQAQLHEVWDEDVESYRSCMLRLKGQIRHATGADVLRAWSEYCQQIGRPIGTCILDDEDSLKRYLHARKIDFTKLHIFAILDALRNHDDSSLTWIV